MPNVTRHTSRNFRACSSHSARHVTHYLAQVCFAAIRHPRLLPELADGGCITLAGLLVKRNVFETRDDDNMTQSSGASQRHEQHILAGL